MPAEDQVVVLYALTKGFMDDVAVDKIKTFEEGLIEYTRRNAKTFYKEVIDTKMWTDAGEAELVKVMGDFKQSFTK
jgi:F-type H+-transporting ATPase subunit alpha